LTDNGQPWHAFAAIFITGATWSLDWTARRALIGDIFTAKALTNALSLDAGLNTGSNIVGPLFGTVLIRFGNYAVAYAGIVALVGSALLLTLSLQLANSQTSGLKHDSPVKQLRDAAAIMFTNRALLAAVLLSTAFNFFGFPVMQMLPVIGRD